MSTRRAGRHGVVTALVAAVTVSGWAATAHAIDKTACVVAADNGQRLRKNHKLVASRAEFLVCAQAECPGIVSQDCVQWLGSVERSLASVIVRAHDTRGTEVADLRVSLDGSLLTAHPTTAPIEVDPGEHVVLYEGRGFLPVTERITLREGEREHVLSVELLEQAPSTPAAPPSEPQPTEAGGRIPIMAWALGGVGVVGIGSFVAFGLAGQSQQADLRDSCAPTCTHSQVSPVQTKFAVANVSLAIGVVALGAGVVLAIVNASHGSEPAKTNAALEGLARGWHW
jgi:hypothetical protein